LSPTGTLGNRIFPGSIDGGVSQRQANSIAVASTNHLNPYGSGRKCGKDNQRFGSDNVVCLLATYRT